MLSYPGKTIPGRPGRMLRQRLQQRWRNGTVQEMNQRRIFLSGQFMQIVPDVRDVRREIGVALRLFRAKGALMPVAAARAAIGENFAGRKVLVPGETIIIRR